MDTPVAHRATGGHQGLAGYLAAEHPLSRLVGLEPAEDVDLDGLEVEQTDQEVEGLAHLVMLAGRRDTALDPGRPIHPKQAHRACTGAPTAPRRTGRVVGVIVLIRRVWDWLHTHEGQKLFRYTMVSAISTVVANVVLLVVYGVMRRWSEVPSAVFANAVATFPSYWLNRSWAWGKSGRSHLMKEVVPFWAMAAGGIAFAIFGAALARHVGISHHLHHVEQTALLVAANFASFGIFWVLKLMLFNRLFHAPSVLEEIDARVESEELSLDVFVR
jgi:putative flippase GtrA